MKQSHKEKNHIVLTKQHYEKHSITLNPQQEHKEMIKIAMIIGNHTPTVI